MQKKFFVLCLAGALPFGLASIAAAQSELSGTSISGTLRSSDVILTTPVEPGAMAYKTESGIYLYPSAFLGFGHNDNVLSEANNPIGSNFVNFAPKVIAELRHKGDRYTARASLDALRYSSSSEDNVTKSDFEVAGDNYFSARARAGWSLGRVNGADPRGLYDRPISADPDRWHSNDINGRLIYGAPEAKGRFEVDLGSRVRSYDTNRSYMAGADLTQNSVAGRVFFRLGTRTLALAEVRNANLNYAANSSDNTERRYYAGLTWEGTAATTGIVKVGRMTKDFAEAGRDGYSGSSWEAGVRWAPRTYSVFELNTGRSTDDTWGLGNYALNTNTDVVWNHKWTQSLTSRVAVGVLNTDYAGINRADRANSYALTVDYALLRWLKVGVDLARTDNSSNDANAAFRRNVGMLTLNASL